MQKFTLRIEMEQHISHKNSALKGLREKGYDDSRSIPKVDEQRKKNLRSVHALIKVALEKVVPLAVAENGLSGGKDYTGWAVEEDSSIMTMKKDTYGVELVSKVMETDAPWKSEIRAVWQDFDIKVDRACGTHVHIKPKDSPYTLSELKAIGKGATLHSNATPSLVSNRCLTYCQPNHNSPRLKDFKSNYRNAEKSVRPGKLFAWIESHHKMSDLVHNVCKDREVAWNLQPVLENDKRGTIQFRLPSQVEILVSAHYWIAFTHAFVHHCLNVDFDKVKFFPASPLQLEEAIQTRAKELGISELLQRPQSGK